MANLDEIAMRSVRKLADLLGSHDRRLARLETAQDARRTSLDDGEVIELRGQSGEVVGTFGRNPDGTYATVPFDGPAPRRLIEPSVDDEGVVDAGEVGVASDAPGTITVKFSPKQVLPSDFAGVDFFYTSGEDRVLLGSVTSLTGGAKTVAVKPGAYEVVAQMRSIPGKTTPLDRKFPVTVVAPVDVKEFDNAKAKLSIAQSQIDALLAAPPSAGVSVSATPPSDPKDGDMWLHPVTDDMGNTVHVLQVFQAGAWVTVEDQDAKEIAAGAKASADAATQTAALAKTTAEQAANGTVDVTRLAADSTSTVKESVVGKLWDVIRAKLVAAKQIITEDMLATGSVTASKITASEELSAKAAKFLRITADQIEAGTLNAKVKIGSEGSITVGNNDIVLDTEKISVGRILPSSLQNDINKISNQIVLNPRQGISVYVPCEWDENFDQFEKVSKIPGIEFIAVDQNQNQHPYAALKISGGNRPNFGIEVTNEKDRGITKSALEIHDDGIQASLLKENLTGNNTDTKIPILDVNHEFPVTSNNMFYGVSAISVFHAGSSKAPRPQLDSNNPWAHPLMLWAGYVEPENMFPPDIWIEPPQKASIVLSNIRTQDWETIEPVTVTFWEKSPPENGESACALRVKGKVKRIGEDLTDSSSRYWDYSAELKAKLKNAGTANLAFKNPGFNYIYALIANNREGSIALSFSTSHGDTIPKGTVLDIDDFLNVITDFS